MQIQVLESIHSGAPFVLRCYSYVYCEKGLKFWLNLMLYEKICCGYVWHNVEKGRIYWSKRTRGDGWSLIHSDANTPILIPKQQSTSLYIVYSYTQTSPWPTSLPIPIYWLLIFNLATWGTSLSPHPFESYNSNLSISYHQQLPPTHLIHIYRKYI